jgi:ferrous iron transport protein A
MEIFLIHLKTGEKGLIREILGGQRITDRLNALGIRQGSRITKLTEHFWHGPVTILIGKTKVAIGYGMAKKILVEKINE